MRRNFGKIFEVFEQFFSNSRTHTMSQFVAQAAKLQLISRHQVLFYEFCVAEKNLSWQVRILKPSVKRHRNCANHLANRP